MPSIIEKAKARYATVEETSDKRTAAAEADRRQYREKTQRRDFYQSLSLGLELPKLEGLSWEDNVARWPGTWQEVRRDQDPDSREPLALKYCVDGLVFVPGDYARPALLRRCPRCGHERSVEIHSLYYLGAELALTDEQQAQRCAVCHPATEEQAA